MTNEKELLSAKLVQLQRDNDAAQLTITQKGEEVNCYQKKYGVNAYNILVYMY